MGSELTPSHKVLRNKVSTKNITILKGFEIGVMWLGVFSCDFYIGIYIS